MRGISTIDPSQSSDLFLHHHRSREHKTLLYERSLLRTKKYETIRQFCLHSVLDNEKEM